MTALSISVGKEIALTPEQTGSKERDGWKFIIALALFLVATANAYAILTTIWKVKIIFIVGWGKECLEM